MSKKKATKTSTPARKSSAKAKPAAKPAKKTAPAKPKAAAKAKPAARGAAKSAGRQAAPRKRAAPAAPPRPPAVAVSEPPRNEGQLSLFQDHAPAPRIAEGDRSQRPQGGWQRPMGDQGQRGERGGRRRAGRGSRRRGGRGPVQAPNRAPGVSRDQLQALRIAAGRLLQELGYRHLLEWTREKVIIEEVEQWRDASPPSLQKATLEILDLHGKVPQEAKGLLDSSTGDLLAVCFGKGRGVMREVTYDILLPQNSGKVFLGEAGQTKDRPEPAVGLFARSEFVPNWFRNAGRLDRAVTPPLPPHPSAPPRTHQVPVAHPAAAPSVGNPRQNLSREAAWRERQQARSDFQRQGSRPRNESRPPAQRPEQTMPPAAPTPAPVAPAATGKVSLMAIPADLMERLRGAAKARGVTPLEWLRQKLDGR